MVNFHGTSTACLFTDIEAGQLFNPKYEEIKPLSTFPDR